MNKFKSGLLGLTAFAMLIAGACTPQQGNVDLDNMNYEVDMADSLQKLSYALGVSIGKGVKSQGLEEISKEAFLQAITDVYKDDVKLTDQEANQFLQQEFAKLAQKKAESAKADGVTYLEENGKKDGVNVTESGLQYEVITEGNGPKPGPTDRVEVHYHGTLIDGSVFDSSVERGKTSVFGVNQVIRGWTEGLQLMSTGSKYKFTIPQELAYGAQGSRGGIPPYSTLVFEVELVSIEGK